MLTNSPKTSNITKRDIFQLLLLSEWWENMLKLLLCRFQHGLGHLACWMSKSVLKRGFLDIYLTASFAIRNFGNTSAKRIIIFFFKISKIWCRSQKWTKHLRRNWLFLENIIWIGCCRFLLLWGEYLSWAVYVLKRVLRTQISLRERFSGSVFHRVIEKSNKSAVVQVSAVFGTL